MIASLSPVNRAGSLRVNIVKAANIITTTKPFSRITIAYLYPARRSAVSLFSACARMSKSGSSSSTSSINAARNNIYAKKQQKETAALPTERQRTLNKFLGLPLEQRQTRVDSLFRKQSSSLLPVPVAVSSAASVRSFTTTATATASGDHDIMEIDASSDVEQVNTVNKANGAQSLYLYLHCFVYKSADAVINRQKETRCCELR